MPPESVCVCVCVAAKRPAGCVCAVCLNGPESAGPTEQGASRPIMGAARSKPGPEGPKEAPQ